jgi:hypothetical protein
MNKISEHAKRLVTCASDDQTRLHWKPGTLPIMHLDSDCHFTTNPKHALVAFNAWFMRPFASEQVEITLSDGALGPIILSPETGKSFLDQDWFALIIPMRMK